MISEYIVTESFLFYLIISKMRITAAIVCIKFLLTTDN